MDLNDYKVNTVQANTMGTEVVFTFLIADNPTLESWHERNKIIAHCVAYYPQCVSGRVEEIMGLVVFTFQRSIV